MRVINLDAPTTGRRLPRADRVPGTASRPAAQPEVLFVASASDPDAGSITLSLAFPGALRGTSINLDLFDARGQRVATLLRDSPVEDRPQRVNWSGRAEDGHLLDGVFFARLTTARGAQVLQFTVGEPGGSGPGGPDGIPNE